MTLLELQAECTRARMNREQCGLDPNTAHLVLVVPGTLGRRGPGARKRVLPGLYGRAIGETDHKHVLVDVMVVDVEAWLTRQRTSDRPTSG